MSKSLARLITGFASLVTLPLKSKRRMAAKVTASEYLAATVTVETAKGPLLFYTNTRRAYHYPWMFHEDEPDTIEWIDGFDKGACFWDVGANIGTFSLYAGLRKDLKTLAFEPSASSFGAFVRNIEANGMDDRISAYCLAFAGNTGLDVLYMENTEAGHSMHGFGNAVNAYDEQINTKFQQAAIGYSIDEFVEKFSPTLPDYLKIDVDGIEADIIRGGQALLALPSLKSVLIEVMDDLDSERNREIIDLMAMAGWFPKPKASPAHRNLIFERQD